MKKKQRSSSKRYKARLRQAQVDAGFFDGRFRTRTKRNKKKYRRTRKYKNYE